MLINRRYKTLPLQNRKTQIEHFNQYLKNEYHKLSTVWVDNFIKLIKNEKYFIVI